MFYVANNKIASKIRHGVPFSGALQEYANLFSFKCSQGSKSNGRYIGIGAKAILDLEKLIRNLIPETITDLVFTDFDGDFTTSGYSGDIVYINNDNTGTGGSFTIQNDGGVLPSTEYGLSIDDNPRTV